ncbi:MAG TPA: oxidase [Epsilonproteobacteria bacterium]|nr:oxidase [Campylobacterota bacterium]
MMKVLLYSTIPGLLFYTVAFNILHNNGYHTMEIIRDFAQQMDESSFLGFLSSIGTWLWVSATAIAFFGFMTVQSSKTYRHRELLFLLGVFSLLLAFDDFFMIHDRYIDQNICYGTYAFLAIALLLRHYKTIIMVNGFGFIFAGTLLAASIFTDLIQDYLPFRYSSVQIFEEGFKFTGAATWLYFVALVAAYHFDNKMKKTKKKRK